MSNIKAWFKNLIDNPRTSAIGIAGIVGTVAAFVKNPALMQQPESWVVLLTAIGLLVAADQKKAGK